MSKTIRENQTQEGYLITPDNEDFSFLSSDSNLAIHSFTGSALNFEQLSGMAAYMKE